MSKKILVLLISVFFLSGCSVKVAPIPQGDLANFAMLDQELIYKSQEKLHKPLTMTEAMSRALKYNLENRVSLMGEALANKNLDLAKMDMLPILAASAGYLSRSNVNGSSSTSLITNRQSLEPSTSQESDRSVGDIRFAWNILDFGVSYLQAKQESDRYLISKQTRQDIMLKLLHQVRGSFWRAAVMQSLSGDIDEISNRVDISLKDLEQVRSEQLRTPISTLNDIRVLLDMLQQLETMQNSVNLAQVELATLINTPPGTMLSLVIPEDMKEPPTVPDNIEFLELSALMNSPNYVSQIYNARIDQLETRKSLMRLLPGLEFSYSANYDSNNFLVNNAWGEAGIRITSDLMRILSFNDIKEYGEAREQLAMTQRLAINMAVVAQVHLSWQGYRNTTRRLHHAKRLNDVDREISNLTHQAQSSDAVSGVEGIQNEIRSLRSKMAHLLAYAETQDSYGSFLLSLGLNPIPENYQELTVDVLAGQLQSYYDKIDNQEFLELTAPAEDMVTTPLETLPFLQYLTLNTKYDNPFPENVFP